MMSRFSHQPWFTWVTSVACFMTLSMSSNVWAKDGFPEKIDRSLVWYIDGADWSDVRDDLKMVIEERGIIISYVSHAREMLNRTGPDLGFNNPVYKDGEIFLFCSASLSHKLVKVSPHFVNYCPYSIAVYETTAEPGRVYLGFAEPIQGVPEYDAIVELLSDIIATVVDGY